MKSLVLCLIVLALGAMAGSAVLAGSASYSASVPLQTTNWSSTLSFPQFNPAIGTLQSVAISVRDSLVSGFKYENLSTSSGSTMRDSSKCTVQVLRPDNSLLLSTVAAVQETCQVTVYDGSLDYAGTSGRTFNGVVNVGLGTSSFLTGADLALFTGVGTIGLPCNGIGWGYLSSTGGNNRNSVSTQAGAWVTVTYTYLQTSPVAGRTWGALRRSYR
jgi:hypothetical protein